MINNRFYQYHKTKDALALIQHPYEFQVFLIITLLIVALKEISDPMKCLHVLEMLRLYLLYPNKFIQGHDYKMEAVQLLVHIKELPSNKSQQVKNDLSYIT